MSPEDWVGPASEKDVTTLLMDWSSGDRAALDQLTPLIYQQLRVLAEQALRRERPGHTLQSTALAHEAFLKLVDQQRVSWKGREHFFAVAARIIRRILVDHARSRKSLKRGGGNTTVTFEEQLSPIEERSVDMIALDQALEALSKMDPQQGRIIELRFFGGLSIESTAHVLGISPSTVNREWNLARAWLFRELSPRAGSSF
jgi:RNA polymerase sigma factor (TIGR02999 family)